MERNEQVTRSLDRWKRGFGDLGLDIDSIVVNVFHRDITFERKVLEWAVIDAHYSTPVCRRSTSFSGEELIRFAKQLHGESDHQMEKHHYDSVDARENYVVDLAKFPDQTFQAWVYAIFKNIEHFTCSASSVYGFTVYGISHWNTKGGLRLISEQGGNDTGTDYNAVFFDDPQMLPGRV
mgnify:FL=1